MTKLSTFFPSRDATYAQRAKEQSDARFDRRETAVAQRTDMANIRSRTIAAVIVVGSMIWLVATW